MSTNGSLDPDDPTLRAGALCYECGAEFEVHVDPDHPAPNDVARIREGDGPTAAWMKAHRARCPGRRPANAPPAGTVVVNGPPSEPYAVWWDQAGDCRRIREDLYTVEHWQVTDWHLPLQPGTYMPRGPGEIVYALRDTAQGRRPVAVRVESIAYESRVGARFSASANVVSGVTALGERVQLVVGLGEVFADAVEAALMLHDPPKLELVVDFRRRAA